MWAIIGDINIEPRVITLYSCTAVRMESLTTPRPMTFTGNMSDNWKRFKQRFDIYRVASGASEKEADLQVSLLLHVMGEEALDVFNSFTLTDEEKKDFDGVVKKFEDYFMPQKNVIVERFNFNKCFQETGEEFDHFLTRIKNLSTTCEFADVKDSLIRDRIVSGITDNFTRERLLAKKGLELSTAVEMCRTSELAKQHLKTLNDSHEVATVGKNRESQRVNGKSQSRFGSSREWSKGTSASGQNMSQKWSKGTSASGQNMSQKWSKGTSASGQSMSQKCGRCGTRHQRNDCPAFGKTCMRCNRKNHFAKLCLSVHSVENYQSDCESGSDNDRENATDCLYFDTVEVHNVNKGHPHSKDWIIPLEVNGCIIPFKLDTGAQANVITSQDFRFLSGVKLHNAKETLRGYTGEVVPVRGKCVLPIKFGHSTVKTVFYVSENTKISLLGRDMCEKLGLVTFNPKIDQIEKESTGKLKYEKLKEEYKDVFEGLGCIPGEHEIHIDRTVTPVVHPCRKIPFPQYEEVKLEIEKMEKLGVIVKVDAPTEWVSSILVVPKPNGKMRICLDPKDLNRAIKRQHYKLPTREEILAQFSDARIFTKLDASQGFWQMRLDDESSYLTTFNTPFGRYRYLRLPYGIKSAPEVYHKRIHEMFEGIPNVDTSMDDIIIYGKNDKEHDLALNHVMERVNENNLKLNADKCIFGVQELVFLGDKLTSKGVQPDPGKVSAIQNMPTPTDKTGVQRFLGMVQYLGKWIPDLSEITTPLRELLHFKNVWEWTDRHEKSFNTLKDIIVKQPTLVFYDPEKPIKISSDASKDGLGAVLLQLHGSEWRPVAFASRSMISAETRYAQIEKELLSIAFACDRFHQFIYGSTFISETDHKPLVNIFKKSLCDCPLRVQRLLLRLQRYDMEVVYVPGKLLVTADTLSRAVENIKPTNKSDECLEKDIDMYVNAVINTMPFSDKRLNEVREKTNSDVDLTVLKDVILGGWPHSKPDCPAPVMEYWNVRDELSVADDVIYKGSKIVIPKSMRKQVLIKIHEGHMGIDKCKKRGREVLYWPRISLDIEQMVQNCSACLKYSAKKPREPLMPHEIPIRGYQRVSSDLFSCHNKDFLIVTDSFSFYPEVTRLPSTNSKAIIEGHKTMFARHGTPDVLMTDNGPQYTSNEFRNFAKDWDFQHITSSPHFPSSNGSAEAAVKVVKNMLLKCTENGDDFYKAIQAYRATPLECGKSPAQLLMHRRIKTSLPIHSSLLKTDNDSEIVNRKVEHKEKLKMQYDKHSTSAPILNKGDYVCVLNPRSHLWDKHAIVIEEISPRSYVVEADGVRYRRNSRHLKKIRNPEIENIKEKLFSMYSEKSNGDLGDQTVVSNNEPTQDIEPLPTSDSVQDDSNFEKTRPIRLIKRPQRLIEQC